MIEKDYESEGTKWRFHKGEKSAFFEIGAVVVYCHDANLHSGLGCDNERQSRSGG
jgi:hypothetical protein